VSIRTIPAGLLSVSATTETGTYKDLRDFGFVLERPIGVFSSPVVSYASAQLPGVLAGIRLHSTPTGSARSFSIEGNVVATSAATLTSRLRDLTGWCARAVAVKSVHDSSTFLRVRQASVTVDPIYPIAGPDYAARVIIEFEAVDGLWYATSTTTATFTGGAASTALGTAISYPVVRVTGALTNPTITVKDSSGATVATMGLTVVLANAAHYVEIDMTPATGRTIVKHTGSLSTAEDLLTSGDFFGFDPANADTVTPTWGTIEVAVTAGSVSAATAIYRKAYY
jgi:hypothetical protein